MDSMSKVRTVGHTVYHLGIDVGSTTVKTVVADPIERKVLYARYTRHHARQFECVWKLLAEIKSRYPASGFKAAVCGSGGKPLAELMDVPYIQEVVANSIAIRKLHDTARTAIELGGQDAKIIFFNRDVPSGQLTVSDMRMNGSCAGGTGAFIDEIASLLKVSPEEFEALACKGTTVHDISGRCGVYAKTDIQPLLNQGAKKEDIALSAFHAIAKQTIGGLAQGLEIQAPVIFEGGPLTFNPTLVKVFAERLGLEEAEIIRPEKPETIVALGTAISVSEVFSDVCDEFAIDDALSAIADGEPAIAETEGEPLPFFESEIERKAFEARHAPVPVREYEPAPGGVVEVYLGIDSGSTTTKFVLIDRDETIVDRFYAPNEGEPLEVAKHALIALRNRFRNRGIELKVLAVGTTGYGERLFTTAFSSDYPVVETVAHAEAARKYQPDATFILDIGGQDIKAISLDKGIITDIVVNEACSSGCGSFLENFASSLNIPVGEIAHAAFASRSPAVLGSRCTVFMNSRIVTEQRNGKSADDIMAGLCRSIIENVFTKVIRLSSLSSLGDRIVVQGGTFKNDAVLRALEQYTGADVVRAPYPEVMGAIGAALHAKRKAMESDGRTGEIPRSGFIGLDAMESFFYTQESGKACPFCSNHCARTTVKFSNGSVWVTGNRCEKGEVIGDPSDEGVRAKIKAIVESQGSVPNMFEIREKLLFKDYPYTRLCKRRKVTLGLPRVLEFWNSMPFWSTFFRALGFDVEYSHPSSHRLYERGLPFVTSDTVCFPAKLVHGHIRDLVDKNVDRIFMPSITCMESENTEKTSESVCAVVKGYPMVVRNSDNPERRWGIPFDHPLFHWYTAKDRNRQLCSYIEEQYGIPKSATMRAIAQGDEAIASFDEALQKQGRTIIDDTRREGRFAVVLASRPYQNDALVNHDLPRYFTARGIPVLTVDSVPGFNAVDLTGSRLDIVNNFHARMLSTAIIAAEDPNLEYVQIVSFGCGHDALLSDEIVRLMGSISGKVPLILKLDESDIAGPLNIRVSSFIETVKARQAETPAPQALPDPYPVKYEASHREGKVILVPNVSRAFCKVMSASMSKQGVRAEPLPLGGHDAIRLGKKYVHNDICFPAQMTIGEALSALESGGYDDSKVAIGTGKLIGDCRLTHYAALLRKALDDAGYAHVPIITNDDIDRNGLHPGYKMGIPTQARIAFALPMIDALEGLLRKIRPYELIEGQSDEVFEEAVDLVAKGIERHGLPGSIHAFKKAIDAMATIQYNRSNPKTQVLVIGEYLLNFHPGANNRLEEYLEKNGLEVIEPRMTDVYRKGYYYRVAQIKEYRIRKPLDEKLWLNTADKLFDTALTVVDRIASAHPLYEPACRLPELVEASDPIIHHTFDSGEGVLIPAEILHHAEKGVRAFAVLQPFGCLPNHICGRGVTKRIKELYPDAQILPLDYDPDTSFANIENRLQMLIMNSRMENSPEIKRPGEQTTWIQQEEKDASRKAKAAKQELVSNSTREREGS